MQADSFLFAVPPQFHTRRWSSVAVLSLFLWLSRSPQKHYTTVVSLLAPRSDHRAGSMVRPRGVLGVGVKGRQVSKLSKRGKICPLGRTAGEVCVCVCVCQCV